MNFVGIVVSFEGQYVGGVMVGLVIFLGSMWVIAYGLGMFHISREIPGFRVGMK